MSAYRDLGLSAVTMTGPTSWTEDEMNRIGGTDELEIASVRRC